MRFSVEGARVLVPALLLASLILMVFPLAGRRASGSPSPTVVFYENGRPGPCSFKVEVASTPEEQTRGLMFVKHLDPERGMLFVFGKDEMRSFWMRNTLIPLDMIFITSARKVVHVHHGAIPLDETPISSRAGARYVLEVNGGKADMCRIKTGTKVKFTNLSP